MIRLILLSVVFVVVSGVGHAAEFAIPTANSQPSAITVGPDGNLWFTESLTNKIGRITPAGVITEFVIPTASSQPSGITAGPCGDGSQCLWFTERVGNKIGRITPAGVITGEFPIPTASSQPVSITAGPDGNLWFTESTGKIGRITPAGTNTQITASIREFVIPTQSSLPISITAGPDGNLWFTENQGNKIGRITPTGVITEFALPLAGFPGGITAGPDGNLWFTERGGNRIGRITPAGVFTGSFSVPTSGGFPDGIVAGRDGNLWFTEAIGKIGRITLAGVITEFAIPTANSQPTGIASSPDTNLWYVETSGNNIGNILPPVAAATPLPPAPTAQTVYVATAGQLPAAAIDRVDPIGTFQNATLRVTLNIANALQTIATTTGFAAGEYSVYVIALVPGALGGSPSPFLFVKPKAPGNWGRFLQFPIAAFLDGVAQNSVNNQVLLEILTNNDLSSLVGTEFYIGYGLSDQEMLAAGRYRGVFKAQ